MRSLSPAARSISSRSAVLVTPIFAYVMPQNNQLCRCRALQLDYLLLGLNSPFIAERYVG